MKTRWIILGLAAMGGPAFAKPLALNHFVEWSAEKVGTVATYEVAGLSITLKSVAEKGGGDDPLKQPLVIVSSKGMKPVVIKGELSSGFGQSLGVGPLTRGSAPSVIVQSYSGGAHCCNIVKALVPGPTGYKIVELGGGDGGPWEAFPKDISGNGVVDIVESDGAFNYAFSSYAGSFAPPMIHNLAGTSVVNVSKSAAFRPLFAKFMVEARTACISAEVDRNGGCAGYVAAAARVGRFDAAWAEMLKHYDRAATDFPTGCRVPMRKGECPAGKLVKYKSFPAALRPFLVENDYLAR
jgi:hypothetical protein